MVYHHVLQVPRTSSSEYRDARCTGDLCRKPRRGAEISSFQSNLPRPLMEGYGAKKAHNGHSWDPREGKIPLRAFPRRIGNHGGLECAQVVQSDADRYVHAVHLFNGTTDALTLDAAFGHSLWTRIAAREVGWGVSLLNVWIHRTL